MTDYLGDEAVRAINANRNRPFFMYLAFNAPHVPLQALKSDYDALPQINDHRLRVYGAMIRALDRNVGHVMSALKENGLDKNTLVIFTSDNGGANYIGLPNINRPYRGWKATFFEGGIHVPFFMRWPAKIAAGSKYNLPIAHTDIFATVAAAAGAPLPTDRVMDGVNVIPFVTGASTGFSSQNALLALGSVQDVARWRVETAGLGAAAEDVAVRLEDRSNRARESRLGPRRPSSRRWWKCWMASIVSRPSRCGRRCSKARSTSIIRCLFRSIQMTSTFIGPTDSARGAL